MAGPSINAVVTVLVVDADVAVVDAAAAVVVGDVEVAAVAS